MKLDVIYNKSSQKMDELPDKSIDLIIADPPYMKGYANYFYNFKQKLKANGQILWFTQPIELYDLPEKPYQILIWKEPYSPKPIRKKYREFLDIIAWYAYGNYTFNKLLWNLMTSVFEDVVIGYKREHKWQKPKSLIERLILVHTNPNNIILAPFAGAGTALIVAKKLGRRYVGYEIDKDYCEIAKNRLKNIQPELVLTRREFITN